MPNCHQYFNKNQKLHKKKKLASFNYGLLTCLKISSFFLTKQTISELLILVELLSRRKFVYLLGVLAIS